MILGKWARGHSPLPFAPRIPEMMKCKVSITHRSLSIYVNIFQIVPPSIFIAVYS